MRKFKTSGLAGYRQSLGVILTPLTGETSLIISLNSMQPATGIPIQRT
jgi:hypothetical protein